MTGMKRTVTVTIIKTPAGTGVLLNGHTIAGVTAGREPCETGIIWSGIDTAAIIDALPHNTDAPMPIEPFAQWLATGERGASSNAIVQRLTRTVINPTVYGNEGATDAPYDPADFRRCVALLDTVPQAREHLHLMADVSDRWARIIDHWDELEQLLRLETLREDGNAPHLHQRLQNLNNPSI